MIPTVAFVGPSLPGCDDAMLGATVRPPAKRGCIPGAVEEGFRRIVLIDGEFAQSLSVSISEVREAIQSGVDVWGASSMGALRAADCHTIGMRGIGWIFRGFRSGMLKADDEVALLFDPDTGQPLTVPLVNIRWALIRATRAGVIATSEARPLLDFARSIPYTDRTMRSLERCAQPSLRLAVGRLTRFISANPGSCDRKRLDALIAVRQLRYTP